MCMLAVMNKDLAEFKDPIGDLFAGRKDLPFQLADPDVEFFEQNGYLSGIRLLDEEQIDTLRREIAELMHPHY